MAQILTAAAIEGMKAHVERVIAYGMYTINGKTHRVPITRRERLEDGRVALFLSIVPDTAADAVVERVQLYDNNGDLWADKDEYIMVRALQEGVLYRFTIDFTEKEEE